MATLLYRLGKASYTNAGRVLIAWIMALLVLGGGGIAFSGQTNEEFRIPGSESQAAFDRLEAVFPSFGGGSAQAVLVVPEGDRVDTPENRRFIEEFGAAIEAETYIDGVTTPFDEFAGDVISDDGRYALVQIVFVLGEREITDDILDSLVGFADMAEGTDITIEFGGSLFQDQGVHLTIAEVFGVAFAGLVLIVTFRSFRPAWQPITSALFGVGIAIGIICSPREHSPYPVRHPSWRSCWVSQWELTIRSSSCNAIEPSWLMVRSPENQRQWRWGLRATPSFLPVSPW